MQISSLRDCRIKDFLCRDLFDRRLVEDGTGRFERTTHVLIQEQNASPAP
jgi:hypothetical protein